VVVVLLAEACLGATARVFGKVTAGPLIVWCEKVSCSSLALAGAIAFNSQVSLVKALASKVRLIHLANILLYAHYTVFFFAVDAIG